MHINVITACGWDGPWGTIDIFERSCQRGLHKLIISIFLVFCEAYLGLKKGYLFMYNLVQFLGFSWIFVNLTVRLFILGQGLFAHPTSTPGVPQTQHGLIQLSHWGSTWEMSFCLSHGNMCSRDLFCKWWGRWMWCSVHFKYSCVCVCVFPSADSFYDTFHTTADMMYFCQMMAVLEVVNPLLGLVKTGFFPAMIQVIVPDLFKSANIKWYRNNY